MVGDVNNEYLVRPGRGGRRSRPCLQKHGCVRVHVLSRCEVWPPLFLVSTCNFSPRQYGIVVLINYKKCKKTL